MGRPFKAFNDKKWEQVRTHPYFEKARRDAVERASYYMDNEPAIIKFSMIHRYVTDGNRVEFQNVYENYFARLETFFVAYMITLDEKYLTPLADIMWNICDFESWSIPAHVSETLTVTERRQQLDLTSTIAGYKLSEVLYFIGDKLPELVVRRTKAEIRFRVLDSFRDATHKRFWWLVAENNWSAVCAASVLATYLYLAEDAEIRTQLPRLLESIKYYLKSFDDEGCCIEGYGYWNYGFSYFCIFASLLRDYTDGEINLFDDPKIHRIAQFQQNIPLDEKHCISFSDGGIRFTPMCWLSHLLKREYPDLEIPSFPPSGYDGSQPYQLLWREPELADCTLNASAPFSFNYKNSQWFIHRNKSYSFACKAGHNHELHNHNDVGSFILLRDGVVSFTDPGGGEYTRQYFSTNERYDLLACSSRGHSVPIINGKYQYLSGDKADIFVSESDKYGFSMQKVYDVEGLSLLRRDFVCGENSVTLTDTYEFTEAPQSVVERFVSYLPIEERDGEFISGNFSLSYDRELLEATVSSEDMADKNGKNVTIYILDMKVKSPARNMTLSFNFH